MARVSSSTVQQIATLLVLSTVLGWGGCGGSSKPAGGDDDSRPDQPASDASPSRGSISVTVKDLTARDVVYNAQVAFIDLDGTTTIRHTNAAGRATALVAAGASVTVKYSDHDLQSILGVEPGDELVFGAGQSIAAPTVAVSFTPLGDPSVDYYLYTSCSGGLPIPATGGTVDLVHCDGSLTDADVYVLAMRPSVDVATAVASVLLQHVDLSDGKPVVLPDSWTPSTALAISYTNPIELDTLVTEVHDRDQFAGAQFPTKPSWTTKIDMPSTGGDAMVRTILQRGTTNEQILEDHLDTNATSYTTDLTARTRPWMSMVIYDPSKHAITTTTEGNAALDADAVNYQVFFGNDGADPIRWSVYAPTISKVTLPAVPSSFIDSTIIDAPASVDAITYETPALVGWESVRPKLYTLASETVDAITSFGTLYVQRYIGFQPTP